MHGGRRDRARKRVLIFHEGAGLCRGGTDRGKGGTQKRGVLTLLNVASKLNGTFVFHGEGRKHSMLDAGEGFSRGDGEGGGVRKKLKPS